MERTAMKNPNHSPNAGDAEKVLLPDSDRLFDPANQLSPTEVRLVVGNIIALYDAREKPEAAAQRRERLKAFAPGVGIQAELNRSRRPISLTFSVTFAP
jgi:hypothetical protein